uniref:Potassium channel domain-containing protein n=1 Tax=Anopheles dirus TaxID=7168 RepID=A0A182NN88_9DIPT
MKPRQNEGPYRKPQGMRAQSLDRRMFRQDSQMVEMDDESPCKTPVLCNKYAIDDVDDQDGRSARPNPRSQSMPRQTARYGDRLMPDRMPYYTEDNEIAESMQTVRKSAPQRRREPRPVHRQARHLQNVIDDNSLYDDEWDIHSGELPPSSIVRPVPIWLCVFLVVSYIIAGAFMFSEWEEWSFLDSAYFCFITLTTIDDKIRTSHNDELLFTEKTSGQRQPTAMERKRSIRRRQKPPFAERAKDHCRNFTAFMFSNVGIIFLVVLYMIAGAFMFIAIEGNEALERFAQIPFKRNETAMRLWQISCCEVNVFNKSVFEEKVGNEIRAYQEKIVLWARRGWQGSDITLESETPWSFSGAFLYSLTVITTIGYGNIVPRTEWGKIATIFYTIIGMPLFLLYLSNIGDILAKSFKWIYAKFCLCRVCPGVARRRAMRARRRAHTEERDYSSEIGDNGYDANTINTSNVDEEIEEEITAETNTVTVPITICIMIMIGYIFFGARLFADWENWDILDGSYFCFISLSSIGFGDIVPGASLQTKGDTKMEISFILCAIYLLLGMALIAMCFNLMQEQVIYKIRSLKKCARGCFRCAKAVPVPMDEAEI